MLFSWPVLFGYPFRPNFQPRSRLCGELCGRRDGPAVGLAVQQSEAPLLVDRSGGDGAANRGSLFAVHGWLRRADECRGKTLSAFESWRVNTFYHLGGKASSWMYISRILAPVFSCS